MTSQPVQAVLYRILGNDLLPRYTSGQTLANLRFTLEHESELPGLEKRWLLNRIVCPKTLAAMVESIQAAGQRFDVIPFEEEAYRRVWTDLGATPSECHPWSETFQQLPRLMQLRIGDYIARAKNQYLMNNNGARNRAIELGLADAEWVLPWDGGCFLPAWAWADLQVAIADPQLHYLCVPMHRLADNAASPSRDDRAVVQWDEPQLGFSRRARLRFDENLRYGSMPKALLLRRIGLPGPWQQSEEGWLPWEHPELSPALDAGSFREVGLVLRLSGEQQDTRHTDLHGLWGLRFASILRFSRWMDARAVRDVLARQHHRCLTRSDREVGKVPDAALQIRGRGSFAEPPMADPPWALICWLALDAGLKRSEPSRQRAMELVDRWCLNAETAWSPASMSLERVAELGWLCPLLDGFALLQEEELFTLEQWQGLQGWCSGLLDWLTSASQDFLNRQHAQAAASWHHLLILALAAFLGRPELCGQVMDNLPGLLVSQYRPDGSPQLVDGASPGQSEQLGNLQAWLQLERLSGRFDRDLLSHRTSTGQSLKDVLIWARKHRLPGLPSMAAPGGSDPSPRIP